MANKVKNCRNCDAPLNGKRFCEECGADSQAKQFNREQDGIAAENAKLKQENEELRKKATAGRPEHDDSDDIG